MPQIRPLGLISRFLPEVREMVVTPSALAGLSVVDDAAQGVDSSSSLLSLNVQEEELR